MRSSIQQAVLTFALLGGCASSPPPQSQSAPSSPAPATPPAAEPQPDIATPPFTAEQIRDATRAGRSYEFRMEAAGKPPVIHKITFVEVTPEHATAEALDLDASGKPLGPPERGTSTWAELVGHAAYPRESTVISDETVEVPAGKFDCMLYTVVDGPLRKRTYFARSLPGAPVLMIVEQDGQRLQTLTLLSHTPGH